MIKFFFFLQHDDCMASEAGVGFTDVGSGIPGTHSAQFDSATFQSWGSGFYSRLAAHLARACDSIGYVSSSTFLSAIDEKRLMQFKRGCAAQHSAVPCHACWTDYDWCKASDTTQTFRPLFSCCCFIAKRTGIRFNVQVNCLHGSEALKW